MDGDLTRRSGPAIGLPGRAPDELPAGEPPASWGIPDHHQSEFDTPRLDVRAASSRGLMHRHAGTERQDEYSVTWHPDTGTLLAVVCDGVGQYPLSQRVAARVCADLPDVYAESHSLRDALLRVNSFLLSDRTRRGIEGATTVVAVAVTTSGDDLRADWAVVGDSSAWKLDHATATWTSVTESPEAELLHDTSVGSLPDPQLSAVLDGTFTLTGPIFLMTDGVSGPLTGSAEVARSLAQWWSTPPHILEFAAQVAFARKSHQDDRTVVAIWPKVDKAQPW